MSTQRILQGAHLLAALMVAAALLYGCQSAPDHHSAQAQSSSRPKASWQQQLEALDCNAPRADFDMRETNPLRFAMIAACYKIPVPKLPHHGYHNLIVVDGARDEVQVTRISALRHGGIHYTDTGDLIWFSSYNKGTKSGEQRFLEVFSLPQGADAEQSLGRIELPFEPDSYLRLMKGGGCHVLRVASFWRILFTDADPVRSARTLENIGEVLYWDSLRQMFVIQRHPHAHERAQYRGRLIREALRCSGEIVPLDRLLQARLAQITDASATFQPSPAGDLLVNTEAEKFAPQVVIFRGDQRRAIGPFQTEEWCYDSPCLSLGIPVSAEHWSPTGQYFMAVLNYSEAIVYRAEDHQIVRRWKTRNDGSPAVLRFIDDRKVFQLNDHSRVSFHEW